MSNSIRTPRQGVTGTSRRIASAVDDEEWQRFRLSMKGMSTRTKLTMLEEYYNEYVDADEDNVCIRADNYIKALCRGGQLFAGESLVTALNHNWDLPIKK